MRMLNILFIQACNAVYHVHTKVYFGRADSENQFRTGFYVLHAAGHLGNYHSVIAHCRRRVCLSAAASLDEVWCLGIRLVVG
jgi:hypothetical protein